MGQACKWGKGDVGFTRSRGSGARREQEVVPRSHAAAQRTEGATAPRRARFWYTFSNDPKDHSARPPAQDGSGTAIPTLYIPCPRSRTRSLVICAKYCRRVFSFYLR